jgi:hypothetical protein
MHKKRIPLLVMLVLLLVAVSGCGLGASAQENPLFLTLTPMSQQIVATLTARAEVQSSVAGTLEAAIARATADGQSLSATQTARASLNTEDILATATAIAPARAELERLGVNPDQGFVAWLQKPVTISLDGPEQKGFPTDQILEVGKDFAVATDITWDTKNSLSGCGFALRSNGNLDEPSQYMVLMSRVANGHILFATLIDGKVANFRELFPNDHDKDFDFSNGGTNRLAVVARGHMFDIYTNGILIDTVDATIPPSPPPPLPQPPPLPGNPTDQQIQDRLNQVDAINDLTTQINGFVSEAKNNFRLGLEQQLAEGLVGFMGLSRRGQMNCTFENSWMFQITPEG